MKLKQRRPRRRARRRGWEAWARWAVEVVAVLTVALIAVISAVGRLADALTGAAGWGHLVPFAAGVLAVGLGAAALLRGWLGARAWLARRVPGGGPFAAIAIAAGGVWLASGPGFRGDLASLRTLLGGRAETQRMTIAHQVYAAYRRADLGGLVRVLERARVYEPTVMEAAAAYGVDLEVLMGVAAAESAFYPRDSADGGRGLFQITAPPTDAVADVRRRLGTEQLDPPHQRPHAFLAAAPLRLHPHQLPAPPPLRPPPHHLRPPPRRPPAI